MNLKSLVVALVATLILGLGTGCTTVERTSYTTLPVVTTPPGATVKTNGVVVGKTPINLDLHRMAGRKELVIGLDLAGFEPVSVKVESKTSWEGSQFLIQRFPVAFFFRNTGWATWCGTRFRSSKDRDYADSHTRQVRAYNLTKIPRRQHWLSAVLYFVPCG